MSGVLSVPAVKAAIPSRYRFAARKAFLRVSAVTNVGGRVACPCCGKRLRKFARFHGLNDQCPSCGSLMRHRALLLYLRDVLRVPERAADVLHVGPGRALVRWFGTLEGLRYVTLDLDSPLAAVHADVTNLPLQDQSFDLILCLHVLEHVQDDRAAMRELLRVLAPKGRAVIQVPPSDLEETFENAEITTPEERERLFGQWDHVRICGSDYGRRLEAAGFRVREIDPVATLGEDVRAEYGLRTGEPFYLCEKPRKQVA
jgi:SAM-dependent methyltransferase